MHYADKPLLTEFRINSDSTLSSLKPLLLDVYKVLICKYVIHMKLCEGQVSHHPSEMEAYLPDLQSRCTDANNPPRGLPYSELYLFYLLRVI